MSKSILFLSKGEHSPSTRYRALSYFSLLQEHGWNPSHLSVRGSFSQKLKVLQAARKSDVVIIIRNSFSFPFLQLLSSVSKKLIFDFDDAIFLKSSGTPSTNRRKRFQSTLNRCDQVWAGNNYLKQNAQAHCKNTAVIPTSINLSLYQQRPPKETEFIDLVWIGSSSTSRYLKDLLPILELASQKIQNLRLKIIADFTLESKTLTIEAITWTAETEAYNIANSHIGIAPMRDDPWTRGKCALKVLQYMACSLPVISSASGVNKEVIQENESGLLASTESEWIDCISQLAHSTVLRQKMGEAGYSICQKQYSQDACGSILLSQLANLSS